MQNEVYCNNCGKNGHLYHQCKLPITSIGIVAFRIHNNEPEFLMIRRKDTLGHVDFMRGKYSVNNKEYIINMLNQMTLTEKNNLKTQDFDTLWNNIWGNNNSLSNQYKNEESISREKYNHLKRGVNFGNQLYNLDELIDESNQISNWEESEWGFPKGRRNHKESDYDCAIREFSEETGYDPKMLENIQNIIPYEEIFTGSNYKSYKHKYFVMYMNYKNSLNENGFEEAEVSKMEWKNYKKCIEDIRDYNIEKKRTLTQIFECVSQNIII
jgi:8-oxo-dGTP pyrophosphatase MutT (NUDIX family)